MWRKTPIINDVPIVEDSAWHSDAHRHGCRSVSRKQRDKCKQTYSAKAKPEKVEKKGIINKRDNKKHQNCQNLPTNQF